MSKFRIWSSGAVVALALATPIVASYEGLRTKAYLDPIGIPTICYGSTSGVRLGDTATKDDCKALLQEELKSSVAVVDTYVTVPLTASEWAAYSSFVYNVGAGNFKKSTLLKKLNRGDHLGACDELMKWTRAGGKVLPGLVRRRESERDLCLQELLD